MRDAGAATSRPAASGSSAGRWPPVTGRHAELGQRFAAWPTLLSRSAYVIVRVCRARPPVDGDLFTLARLDMAVHAVVGDVQLAPMNHLANGGLLQSMT